jgi:hypothetical protein
MLETIAPVSAVPSGFQAAFETLNVCFLDFVSDFGFRISDFEFEI